jgi:hypothetical protein
MDFTFGMRLLVLGGTAWLGGYIATTALQRGHQVTCLARGSSGSAPNGAVFVRADRNQPNAYDAVIRDQWDGIVDVSRQPGQVRGATAALADRSKSFVFISSGNVYADHGTPGQDEGAALLPALEGDVMESMETYGQAKVAPRPRGARRRGSLARSAVRNGRCGSGAAASKRTGSRVCAMLLGRVGRSCTGRRRERG